MRPEASVTSITTDGAIFLVAGSVGAITTQDIFQSQRTAQGFTTPVPVDAWNSPASENWVAVDPSGRFAFIIRFPVTDSILVMQSTRQGDGWTTPRLAQHHGARSLRQYAYRFPFVDYQRSTLYLTSATRLFQLPLGRALGADSTVIGQRVAHNPRPVPALARGEPEVYLPGALRTTNGLAFSPNGRTIYLSQYTSSAGPGGVQPIRIVEVHLRDDGWTTPSLMPFGDAPDSPVTQEYHPVLSPDGATMYFNSRRQADGSVGQTNDLWRVRRTPSGEWGPREPVSAAISPSYDDYASVTRSGSVYFRSDRPGGLGGGDIYVMRMVDGQLQSPVNVRALNSMDNENDVYVDPDERFIVFNRYYPATTELDLFISVRSDTGWTTPRPLTPINTVVDYELTPTLSRDGAYLYVEIFSALLRWRVEDLLTDVERRLVAGPNGNRVPR